MQLCDFQISRETEHLDVFLQHKLFESDYIFVKRDKSSSGATFRFQKAVFSARAQIGFCEGMKNTIMPVQIASPPPLVAARPHTFRVMTGKVTCRAI